MDDAHQAYQPLGPDTRTEGLLERRANIPVMGALALAVVSWACLIWLLYRAVPVYAELFELMGTRLSPLTRLIFATCTWFLRLLPFLVVVCVPTWLIVKSLRLTRFACRATMVAILVSSPLALVASCVVIHELNASLVGELETLRDRAGRDSARLQLDLAGARLDLACYHGSAFACTVVGQMVLEGHVGKRNPTLAQVFLKKGCDGGSDLGCQYLARARREAETSALVTKQGRTP